ncbi:Acyl-CoA N-acyltransferase [Penicillium argentinense]|uniref:N-alpha-acetyltransferase 40 n=1 Tax=Penicillium argentinense TaxID=1131581 RepID=A0A9W9EZ37_9EURO|nr:Acyl-CoA N-acyltransferase [Penicillium argentinense]KAJ5090664.1 Acyl-CoA N-acyltransferase [Penicillium argentinense]
MPATKEGRIMKVKARRSETSSRRVQSGRKNLPLVERTNALPIDQFISQYVSPLSAKKPTETPTEKNASTSQSAQADATSLAIYSATTIPSADLEACLNLIEETSGDAYAASGGGWSRPKKLREMKLPDMKYLIVRAAGQSDAPSEADEPESESKSVLGKESGKVLGFLSFMVTYEDGKEVVYCYEIHLSALARGKGLGALLMGRMEEIGRSVGLEKAMLTVFKSNAVAREFYRKGGYDVDEYSPRPRRLRNGTVKEYDYEILSKRLK